MPQVLKVRPELLDQQALPPASPAMPSWQLLRTSLLPNVELLLH